MASTALATMIVLLATAMSLTITTVSAAAVGGASSPIDEAAAADAFYNDLGGFAGGNNGGSLGAASPAAAASVGDFGDTGFAEGFPPDPSKFKTPEELKDYLERLQLYYALVGRPRFGKRSSGYRRHRSLRGLPTRGDRIYGYAVFF